MQRNTKMRSSLCRNLRQMPPGQNPRALHSKMWRPSNMQSRMPYTVPSKLQTLPAALWVQLRPLQMQQNLRRRLYTLQRALPQRVPSSKMRPQMRGRLQRAPLYATVHEKAEVRTHLHRFLRRPLPEVVLRMRQRRTDYDVFGQRGRPGRHLRHADRLRAYFRIERLGSMDDVRR